MLLSRTVPSTSQSNGTLNNYLPNVSTGRRKLVRLEVDFIPQHKTRWEEFLADLTTDRERATTAINACYRDVGLAQPHILWAENPLTAMTILLNRPDLVDVGSGIFNQIWNSCNTQIESQIAPDFIEVVKAYANPRAQIIEGSQTIAFDPLGDFLNQVLLCEIKKVYPQLDPSSLPVAMQDYRIAYLSYFDYFQQIGLAIPQVQPLVSLAKSCGCCWAFANIAILTPKPSAIEFDDRGKLISLVYDGVNILD